MKQANFNQKTPQQNALTAGKSASAGPGGMAVMPPAYEKDDQAQHSFDSNTLVLQRAAIDTRERSAIDCA